MNNLNVKSVDAARNWQSQVDALNCETKVLLQEVGQALVDVQQGADSTIVDDIVVWGNKILSGSSKIYEGMSELFNVVGEVCRKVNELLEAGKNIIGNIVRNL